MPREGPYIEAGKDKHPLVEREDRIALDDVTESGEIDSETQLGAETHHIAYDIAYLTAAATHTGHYQNHRTKATERHTSGFLDRDRLMDDEEGDNHRKDRHARRTDTSIDRRGDA